VDFSPKRIATKTLDFFSDNTDRQVGVGIAGRWIGWDRMVNLDKDVKKQMDEIEENEHR